jgi:hypothetical protein
MFAAQAGEPVAEELAGEERFELLAAELAAALDDLVVDPRADDVLLVELEELGAVAEEIWIEGDVETAVLLLEEALALLQASAGERFDAPPRRGEPRE